MEAVIGLAVLTVVLLAITWSAARTVRRVRALVRLTPNGAASAAGRDVLLHGVTRPVDGELPAPITGTPCLMARAYEIRRQTRSDSDGTEHTTEQVREIDRVDTRFAIVDPDPPHAWVMIDAQAVQATDLPREPVAAQRGREPRVRISPGPTTSFAEQRLAGGQPVWAVGRLTPLATGGHAVDGQVSLTLGEPSGSATGVRLFGILTVLSAVATLVALVVALA